jgi:hypothetical protein
MNGFDRIPDDLLAPFAGRPDAAWSRTPPGKWSPGQVVDHVTTAIENSARGFRSRLDKPPMRRRPRTPVQVVACAVIFATGWIPPGRKAPETALPKAAPDRAETEQRLRAAVGEMLELERLLLPARARDLFVKHPILGDLTITEWQTFHVRHAAHHRKQIVARVNGA